MAVTATIAGSVLAERIEGVFPGAVLSVTLDSVTVSKERVAEIALFLRDDPALDGKFLNNLTAVDWLDYFEIVYNISSLAQNHSFNLKARAEHENTTVPSVNTVWMGANLQEREVFDLMGIIFEGHPAMRRIFLWEGFPGHPLRKDFLALPGGFKPGLQRFPFEFPGAQRSYDALDGTDSPSAPDVPRIDQPPPMPVPIAENAEPAELVAGRAANEPATTGNVQGAGDDPTLAGGTAEDPGETPAEEPRP